MSSVPKENKLLYGSQATTPPSEGLVSFWCKACTLERDGGVLLLLCTNRGCRIIPVSYTIYNADFFLLPFSFCCPRRHGAKNNFFTFTRTCTFLAAIVTRRALDSPTAFSFFFVCRNKMFFLLFFSEGGPFFFEFSDAVTTTGYCTPSLAT